MKIHNLLKEKQWRITVREGCISKENLRHHPRARGTQIGEERRGRPRRRRAKVEEEAIAQTREERRGRALPRRDWRRSTTKEEGVAVTTRWGRKIRSSSPRGRRGRCRHRWEGMKEEFRLLKTLEENWKKRLRFFVLMSQGHILKSLSCNFFFLRPSGRSGC